MGYKKIRQMLLSSALVCSLAVMPVSAEPSAEVQDLQDQQEGLEGERSAAQSELGSLQAQLEGLLSKIAELENDLVETGQEITQAEEDLKVAEQQREEQYDAMKLRIRYIYESGGDTAALEKVFSSGTMAGLLTQAEYSQRVHEYDRDQLQVYVDTVKKIQDLETTLEKEMADLQDLEIDYQYQQDSLNATISSKQSEISNLDELIQSAAQKVMEQQQREQEERERAQQAAQENGQQDQGSETAGSDNNSDQSDQSDSDTEQEPESRPESETESTGEQASDPFLCRRLGCIPRKECAGETVQMGCSRTGQF